MSENGRDAGEIREDKQTAQDKIQMTIYKSTSKFKIMEEKQSKKLSYEELSKAASDLSVQYQRLMQEYNRAVKALQEQDFNYTSFFLSMLFKVLEHPDLYKKEFVEWCVDSIQGALISFADNMNAGKEKTEPEKKDEAE